MANESRKYAEDLVGNLDRTSIILRGMWVIRNMTQIGKTYKDKYQNLTEDLKLKQEQMKEALPR